jgi:DNA-binding NarL/FixJ family response regulator
VGPEVRHDHAPLTALARFTIGGSTEAARRGTTSVADDPRAGKQLDELRVLLVDDHDLFRTGLRSLLEDQGLQVVAEADNGRDALRLVGELAPDVVVMDLKMPELSGVETTRQISGIAPRARVVVLTISADDDDVMDAVVAGACGYLLKDSSIDQLIAGIRAAARGESLISPQIAGRVLQRLRSQGTDSTAARTIRAELSERELDVLRLIALGHTNNEIAEQLYLSVRTVETHRAHIQQKLGLSTRAELVRYALDNDLIDR